MSPDQARFSSSVTNAKEGPFALLFCRLKRDDRSIDLRTSDIAKNISTPTNRQ